MVLKNGTVSAGWIRLLGFILSVWMELLLCCSFKRQSFPNATVSISYFQCLNWDVLSINMLADCKEELCDLNCVEMCIAQ